MSRGAKKLTTQTVNRPSIYEYHDYRQFLKDWVQYMSSADSQFSLRKFSTKCQLAVGFLPMVLNGQRNLTEQSLCRMLPEMKLKESEQSFLKCLQILSDSNDQSERMKALNKMQKFKSYKTENIKEVKTYKFLSKPLNVIIREMADLKDFQLDVTWIQKKLLNKYTKKEIRSSINFLTENGYIAVDEKGESWLAEKQLDCIGPVFKLGLTKFHKEMFHQAILSIDTVPSHKRSIMGHTLALSHSQFVELQSAINDAIDRITKIDNKKPVNEIVYHTGFVAFPLTEFNGEESSHE